VRFLVLRGVHRDLLVKRVEEFVHLSLHFVFTHASVLCCRVDTKDVY
jgi:hypothetical protein